MIETLQCLCIWKLWCMST